MRPVFLIGLLFFCLFLQAQQPLPAIGLWREHLPYTSATDVASGDNIIFCATSYSLFTLDTRDKTIERWSRVTGLNGTGISAICYDAANDKLVIAYTNSNIDILYRNDIINLPDIKRDNIVGNKIIYAIYPLGKNYYLSSGLGVIVIDGDRYEVKDTWFIGSGGGQVKVNGFTSDAGFFYAATEEGLKKTPLNTINPADHNSWQLVSGNNGLSAGSCQNVVTVQGKAVVQKNDSLFVQNGTTWSFWYTGNWPMINTTVSENKVTVCERRAGESRVTVLNADGTISRALLQPGVIVSPRKAILVQGEPWIADQSSGLLHFTASSYEQFQPNSPQDIASGEMTVYNNVLYATAGGVDVSWNPQHNPNGISIFREGAWTNLNRYHFPRLDTVADVLTIAIDPRDESAWAGSYGGGLLHVKKDMTFDIIKQGVISPAAGDPTSYRVAGLAFDEQNNLWVTNYGAAQPLLVRKSDGNWFKLGVPFLTGNAVTQILVDDNGYKWMIAPGSGLVSLDDNATPESPGDDRWRSFRAGAGNGNLPDGNVLSIAKDKNGFIWIGTANGIGVIQCAQQVFTPQGCEAVWPVVQEGNFAGYLFNGEEVRSIAVDGADRKWVATGNGVWLVSATGEQVIYQFTEENSPLLSNDVKKVTINGQTGEVFFATAKGICSFRSTATEGGEQNRDVLVYPNPVPPGYSGTIGIRGLTENAIVKVTEMDGRLVYQTRALGGQAVWDGRNYRGQKISTGVYLVLISSDNGSPAKAAAKIIFIGK